MSSDATKRGAIRDGMPAVVLRVEFDVVIPNQAASESQVSEWLAYQLGASGLIHTGNGLAQMPLKAQHGSVDWRVKSVGVLRASGTGDSGEPVHTAVSGRGRN